MSWTKLRKRTKSVASLQLNVPRPEEVLHEGPGDKSDPCVRARPRLLVCLLLTRAAALGALQVAKEMAATVLRVVQAP